MGKALLTGLAGVLAVFAGSVAVSWWAPSWAQAPAPALPGVAPPPPLVKAGTARKVSDHVWVIPDDSTPLVPNVGIIAGADATLVVDTGMGARNGQTVVAEAARVAKNRILYLVVTHVHPEHDLGAGAFPPETRFIRSNDQVKDIEAFGDGLTRLFASRSPINAELLEGARPRKATQLFDKEMGIDLGGGVKVQLTAMGPNHTLGDLAVWVEPDRVLFSGDIAMKAQPALGGPRSSLGHWLESLDRLEAFKPRIVVPSHGPNGDVGFITGYRTYLKAVQARTAALKREGKGLDEVVQAVSAELAPRYPDAGRLAGAIRVAYAEAN